MRNAANRSPAANAARIFCDFDFISRVLLRDVLLEIRNVIEHCRISGEIDSWRTQ